MSQSFIKGSGEASSATAFQLLDVGALYGATAFRYDFYAKGLDAACRATWQIDGDGAGGAWTDIGNLVSGLGATDWLQDYSLLAVTNGGVRLNVTAGNASYWYALNSGAGVKPTIREVHGATSLDEEFFTEKGRIYTIVSDGIHSWKYWDGSAWVVFVDGTSSGFAFDSPSTGRILLNAIGAVNFSITSTKA